jgi:class 3 adenylate cyclase
MSGDLPAVLVGLFAAGIGLSFLLADPESSSTRFFALFLGLMAVTFASTPIRGPGLVTHPAFWEPLTGLLEATTLAAGCEWLYRVKKTVAPSGRGSSTSGVLLRTAQVLCAVYGLGAVLFFTARQRYSRGGWGLDVWLDPVFLSLFGPSLLAFAFALAGGIIVLLSDIDAAERVRLRAAGIAVPFLYSGLPMQPPWEYVTTALGEVILLGGAVRYHVMQGQRGQFLGRFLSPQVVRLVRDRGLAAALEQRRGEISVVAFDLRGFTAFAEQAPAEEVMEIVQRYYAAIGEVATRFDGTIKDFAGDGILCLVGAPLPERAHARRALELARAGVAETTALLATRSAALGIGAGVATGLVTTGAVGGPARLEYAAVGPAVNLAARLCDQAGAGEVLADAATMDLAGEAAAAGFEPVGELRLKGIARTVAAYRHQPGARPAS